jgi:4-amino-4-deoxy-L-arabinose transferase-like glycosyltransferase
MNDQLTNVAAPQDASRAADHGETKPSAQDVSAAREPPSMPSMLSDARVVETRRLAAVAAPRIAVPLLLITGMVLYLVNLGAYPLYTKGEPREAVTVFDIVHGGGVILPMRAGVEIPSKPLLMHWLAALVSLAAGSVNEWTVRLPSALLAIAGMVVCYVYVRRLFEERGALLSALMLGTSFQYLQAGTGARVDMTLAFFMEVAFFEFLMIAEGLSERTTLLYVSIALAVLTKGPVGLVLPALVAASWIALWRRWGVLRRLRLGRGAAIVAILAGGWYVAAILAHGSAFVYKQVLSENLFRLLHRRGFYEGHAHPFYYEEGALVAGFMPWSPVALAAAIQWIRMPRRLDPRLGYLVVWFLTVLIFYNLPQSKRGVYLLALYPALTTIVALFISDAITHRETIARWVAAISRAAGAIFVIAGAAGLVGLTNLFVHPAPIRQVLSLFGIFADVIPALKATARDYLLFAIAIPIFIAAIGAYLTWSWPKAEKMVFAIASGFAYLGLAVNLIVEPATARTLSLKTFAAETMRIVGTRPLGYFGSLDYAFAFYSGRDIHYITGREPDPPDYVVSTDDGYKLMPPAMRQRYSVVIESGPTDLDNTGQMFVLKRTDISSAPSTPPRHW